MINNLVLEKHLDELLFVDQFQDYAPNGLQVEGSAQINKVVCGVTASLALIEVAIEKSADAIFVHHGYFWKGELATITGIKQRRIKRLLENNINLYGYHLPLDCHVKLGNNAQLGKLWGVQSAKPLSEHGLMWTGEVEAVSAEDFAEHLMTKLARQPLLVSGGEHLINKIAWCSGGAQNMIEQAALLGADAYISGEISEQTYHAAKEYGIHYYSAGHHATERYGAMAMAKYLSKDLALNAEFVDCDNPV